MSNRRAASYSSAIPGPSPAVRLRCAAAALVAFITVNLSIFMPARAAERPNAAGVLHLTNGGFVNGELKDSDGKSRLGWKSPLFASAFAFDVNAVSSVNFPVPAKLPRPVG